MVTTKDNIYRIYRKKLCVREETETCHYKKKKAGRKDGSNRDQKTTYKTFFKKKIAK